MRLEDPRIDTRKAAGEGKEQVAAAEILFEESDHQKAREPGCAIAKGSDAEEEATVEDEAAGAPESENEKGEKGNSPSQASKEGGKRTLCRETVERDGAG